jgi:hypothetical protein
VAGGVFVLLDAANSVAKYLPLLILLFVLGVLGFSVIFFALIWKQNVKAALWVRSSGFFIEASNEHPQRSPACDDAEI